MRIENGKLQYEAPKLTVHGTFEDITQHTGAGAKFDVSFNAGDPVPDPLDIFS